MATKRAPNLLIIKINPRDAPQLPQRNLKHQDRPGKQIRLSPSGSSRTQRRRPGLRHLAPASRASPRSRVRRPSTHPRCRQKAKPTLKTHLAWLILLTRKSRARTRLLRPKTHLQASLSLEASKSSQQLVHLHQKSHSLRLPLCHRSHCLWLRNQSPMWK